MRALVLVLLASTAFAQLPEAPQPVADRNFWLITGANAGVTVADIITTSTLVGHTASCPYEVWATGLYSRKPTPARTTLVMGGLMVSSAVLSYELKKHDMHIWKLKLWTAPQAYLGYGHTYATIHNLNTCH